MSLAALVVSKKYSGCGSMQCVIRIHGRAQLKPLFLSNQQAMTLQLRSQHVARDTQYLGRLDLVLGCMRESSMNHGRLNDIKQGLTVFTQ